MLPLRVSKSKEIVAEGLSVTTSNEHCINKEDLRGIPIQPLPCLSPSLTV